MANYRVFDPKGDIVSTKTIDCATDAHAWFKDEKADNSELGWRLEVQHDSDGEWAMADDTDGTS